MRSPWPRRIGVLLLAAAVAAGLAYAFRTQPVEVEVADVARGDVRVTVDEEGRTRVRERYLVAAPLGGRLRRVELHAGDAVRAGASVLAVLDPPRPEFLDERERRQAEAQVDVAKAAIERASAEADRAVVDEQHAAREVDRVRRLREAGAASAEEHDAAEHAARVAAEDVRRARRAVRVAEFERAFAEAALAATRPDEVAAPAAEGLAIRSPIDGVVLRVLQESESVVAAGAPLLEIGDASDLEVVAEILTRDAVRITPGASADLADWGGGVPLEARVRRVEPGAFTKVSALGVEEQRVLVVLDLVDPAPAALARLGDGYRVEVRILVDEARDVVVVPTGALFRSGEDWAVYRLAGETVEVRALVAGRSDGRATEVLSGLAEGDRVVLHPGDRVAPGVRVMIRASARGR